MTVNGAWPFEQTHPISTVGLTWNLVEIGRVDSEEKLFNNIIISYMCTAHRAEEDNRVFFPCWCATWPSFPAGVQHGLLSLLVCNIAFFPCWCATWPSSPAEVQHGLLSLLVCNMAFFPCWCATWPSFPAGVQHGLLSLLVCNMAFFPCWCATWPSFPSGAQKDLLSFTGQLQVSVSQFLTSFGQFSSLLIC